MVYKQVLLGDYFKFEKGLGYKGEFLAEDSDVALIGMDSHEEGGGYKEGSEKFYSGPFKSEHVAEVGDVIFAGTEQGFGLLASPLIVPESEKFNTYLFSGDVLKAIPLKSDEFSVEYLYNIYRVEKYRVKTAYGDTGTTVRRISNENFAEQLVPLPDLSTQLAINEIISLIDQQIANNKSLSKNLELLAQSIFKSWFIDFDPVHAKSRGEKPFGMDDETAALFPDTFEESELGMIPKGWTVEKISQLCTTISNGSTPRRLNERYWKNGEVDWYKTGELSDKYLLSSDELITTDAVNETSVKLLPAGSILMAIYASPTVGRLGILTKPSTFNQACTGLIPNDQIGTCYLYMNLFFNRDYFNSMASGAAQQNISKAIVENCPVTQPNQDTINAFRKLCDLQFQELLTISLQSRALETLRDALLPRLISGELQIPEDLLVS